MTPTTETSGTGAATGAEPRPPTARSGETRKVVVHRAGGYDRLVLETAPVPTPGPGQVRIDVAAIGVNFADSVVRMGLYASAKAGRSRPGSRSRASSARAAPGSTISRSATRCSR